MLSNVAITGNRLLSSSDHDIIIKTMQELCTIPVLKTIMFGGALGADTVALQAALELDIPNKPRLIVVVPDKLTSQPKQTQLISEQADQVIELGIPISSGDHFQAYQVRNEYMVDNSDYVVAFWNKIQSGGTYNCIRYALKNNKTVQYVDISGDDK